MDQRRDYATNCLRRPQCTVVLSSAIACAGRMNASEEGPESKQLDHVAKLTTTAAIRSAFSPRRGKAVMAVVEVPSSGAVEPI